MKRGFGKWRYQRQPSAMSRVIKQRGRQRQCPRGAWMPALVLPLLAFLALAPRYTMSPFQVRGKEQQSPDPTGPKVDSKSFLERRRTYEECMRAVFSLQDSAHEQNNRRKVTKRYIKDLSRRNFLDYLLPTKQCVLQQKLRTSTERLRSVLCLLPMAPWRVSLSSEAMSSVDDVTSGRSPGIGIAKSILQMHTWEPPPVVVGIASGDQHEFFHAVLDALGTKPRLLEGKRFKEIMEDENMGVRERLSQAFGAQKADAVKLCNCEECLATFLNVLTMVPKASHPLVGQILIELDSIKGPDEKLIKTIDSLGYRLFYSEFIDFKGQPFDSARRFSLSYIFGPLISAETQSEEGKASSTDCDNGLLLRSFAKAVLSLPEDPSKASSKDSKGQRISSLMPSRLQGVPLGFLTEKYPCFLSGRIGWWDNGGAWVCLDQMIPGSKRQAGNPGATVVTIAGNVNFAGAKAIGFEEELATMVQGTAHVFNPTLPEAWETPTAESKVTFHAVAVVPSATQSDVEGKHSVTFSRMLERIRTWRIDFLRLDCEGCEYNLIAELGRLYNKENIPIQQLGLQLHVIEDQSEVSELFQNLASLGYILWHHEFSGQDQNIHEFSFIHP